MVVLSHVYSEYSLLSSTNRIERLVSEAKKYGYDALALTDHHVMYGAVPFYEACLKHQIKPIFGLELTILDESSQRSSLLRLYAKNEQGYANLLKAATVIGHKPARESYLTRKELAPYLSQVIVILPFKNGPIISFLQSGNYEQARTWMQEWKTGTNGVEWFHEIRTNDEQGAYEYIEHFAVEEGIKLIASHPCFFLHESDAYAYQVAQAIKDGVRASENPLSLEEQSYFLQTPMQMRSRFNVDKEALANTQLLASECTVTLALGESQLPKYETQGMKAEELLRRLCEQGVRKRYSEITSEVRERLDHELAVINQMGFEDYFLIVWDFMKYARERRILTGPGRGSAAGSLVAYVLQITNVDPLKYDLLFERFLNPERVSMPDIDIDFPDHRRDEMIEYVHRKYGKDHVAQIITFGSLGAKAVIRDVGKALGLNQFVYERVAKAIPPSHGMTLEKALKESTFLANLLKDSEEVKELWLVAQQLEGLPRHYSTHAAGVVISDKPLSSIVGLQSGQANISLTQASMNYIEKLGLLKFDFLGLRNLTLLEKMLVLISKHQKTALDLSTLPLDDSLTYELLAKGDTTGVFQLESNGMRRVLTNLKPTEFEDIVAVNALFRPGPMDYIQTYIDGKYGRHETAYVHPDLKPILSKTYGVIVYQEQIMQITSLLANFTLAQSDLLRRAISKKKKESIVKRRKDFLDGAIKKGYTEEVANRVFSLIERFADYGFNRSHAVAYSLISYQLAYIKAHYQIEFYTALFSGAWTSQDKLFHYIQEYKSKGYELLPPSIKESAELFKIERRRIRFGLLPISHVGTQAVQAILQERKKKPFADLFDFVTRLHETKVTKKVVVHLIKAGALDEFHLDRATMLYSVDEAFQFASNVSKFQKETAGLFTIAMETPSYQEVEPLHFSEKLEMEKEVLGYYLSGHPIEPYKQALDAAGRVPIFKAYDTMNSAVQIAGFIIETRVIRTKKGEQMAFCQVSDETGEAELVVFPRVWTALEEIMQEGQAVLVECKLEQSRNKRQFIVQRGIDVDDLKTKQQDKLFLRIAPSAEKTDVMQKVKQQLLACRGYTPVILYYEKNEESRKLPWQLAVDATESCITSLKEILGEENVVLRKASN